MMAPIERDHGLHLLHEMLRIRRFEERCVELYSASKIRGFLHLYIGEEAVAVGAMQALDEDDAVLSTYREHGHGLVRGVPARAVVVLLGHVDARRLVDGDDQVEDVHGVELEVLAQQGVVVQSRGIDVGRDLQQRFDDGRGHVGGHRSSVVRR
jgi:TPP-dependent pyruvate/acetoin dehydrogenase alpha subunit